MAAEPLSSRPQATRARRRLTAPRLILRLAVMVVVLLAADAAVNHYLRPGRDYLDDWRFPRERSMSALGGYAAAISAQPGDATRPTVLVLGASPTWGEASSDRHHTYPAVLRDVAAAKGVQARVFNLGADGELVADQYFLAGRLAQPGDVVLVQLTYHTFHKAGRAHGTQQYPEVPRLLGDPVTTQVAGILGISATPSPNVIGDVNWFLTRHWALFRQHDALTTRLFGSSAKDELWARWRRLTHAAAKGGPAAEPPPRNVPFDALDPSQQTVFVENYAAVSRFRLKRSDSELRILDLLCADLQRRHVHAALFISPVDVQALEGFGMFDRKQYDANVALISRVVVSHGLTFIDWNQPKLALPSGAFADMTHTTDQGSALFAARLFAGIRSLFDRGGGR